MDCDIKAARERFGEWMLKTRVSRQSRKNTLPTLTNKWILCWKRGSPAHAQRAILP